MLIVLTVVLLVLGRFANMYVERMYFREAAEQRNEAERLLLERASRSVSDVEDVSSDSRADFKKEEEEPIVVRSVPYDERLNWRKLFGFGHGKRCWQVYASDVVIVLSVYVLSSYAGWELFFGIALAVLMYTTWLTDVREWYIYDVFTYPAIVLFLVYGIWFGPYVWWLHIAGGLTMLVMLVILSLVMRGKMGIGDIKILTALGFYFGYADIIPVLLSASLIGLVYGGVLKVLRKKSTAFPFGPFIVMGVYIVWISGFSLLTIW